MSDKLYSYHIFLFPFKMRFADKCEDKTLKPNEDKWEPKPFKIENPENYNEYIYFYDFVRESIFDVEKPVQPFEYKLSEKVEKLVQCFEYKLSEKTANFTPRYKIGITSCDKKGQKEYLLPIDKITLAIYEKEGIGILSFFLQNNDYPYQKDILNINDFGKRIYPQFLAVDTNDTNTSYTKATQRAFLAKEISLFLTTNDAPTFKTNFTSFDKINPGFEEQPLIANFITELIGGKVVSEAIKSTSKPKDDEILISPLLDDRMFVLCWYGNNGLSNQYSDNRGDNYGYLQDNFWYQFVFMDNNGPTCQSKFMHTKLVKNATNERWVNYGTLYGVTRYSFVLLTDNGNFGKQTLLPHLKTMYTKMVTLSLVQRAAILKFSSEVVTISDLTQDKISTETADLYKGYIQFVNKIYFREVTPQEQGIELYDLLQKQMRIADHVKDLDNEIAELHNYVSLLEDKKRNEEATELSKQSTGLTKVANIFLPASFVAALMAIISDKEVDINGSLDWDTMFFCIILIGITIAILFYGKKITQYLSKIVDK